MASTLITHDLPSNYCILMDEQDSRFYPQRADGARFAVRTDFGDGSLDQPVSFEKEQDARLLIEYDDKNPHPECCGSILYSEKELRQICNNGSFAAKQEDAIHATDQDIETKVKVKIAELYPKRKGELLLLAEEVARRHGVCGCNDQDNKRVILTFLAFAYRRELEGKPVAV